jgi:hypothetical protein
MITGPWQTFRKRGKNDKCTQDKSLGIFKLPIILAKIILNQTSPLLICLAIFKLPVILDFPFALHLGGNTVSVTTFCPNTITLD